MFDNILWMQFHHFRSIIKQVVNDPKNLKHFLVFLYILPSAVFSDHGIFHDVSGHFEEKRTFFQVDFPTMKSKILARIDDVNEVFNNRQRHVI